MSGAKLWIDVEDLFIYAAHHIRPTGIQRLEFELCHALANSPSAAHRVRFVRHNPRAASFTTVYWSAVERLWKTLTDERRGPPTNEADKRAEFASLVKYGVTRRLVYQLPLEIRVPFLKSLRYQVDAIRLLGTALGAGTRITLNRLRPAPALAADAEPMTSSSTSMRSWAIHSLLLARPGRTRIMVRWVSAYVVNVIYALPS